MTNKEFNIIRDFIGQDEYFYILTKKLANLPSSADRIELNKKVRESAGADNILYININIQSSGNITLQNIPKSGTGNSFIIRKHIITSIVGEEYLETLMHSGLLYIKHRSFIDNKQAIKTARKAVSVQNVYESKKNAEAILNKTSGFLEQKKWIRANKIALTKKSTAHESTLFYKLEKYLKKRVKRQVPFTINGNVYFADICIKCKYLIIEVDGEYHNQADRKNKDIQRDNDFASIGYSTIRVSNQDVENPEFLFKLIRTILKTPNKRN